MSSFESGKKEIPFFSVPDSNKIDDYFPFRHLSSYIKSCSCRFKNKHELLLLCGYAKNSYDKFRTHQEQWNDLKRCIPRKYLSVIKADLQEIQAAV